VSGSHNVAIQVGDIFKHMRLPQYEATQAAHRKIGDLCKKAHSTEDATDRSDLVGSVREAADGPLERWIKKLMLADEPS